MTGVRKPDRSAWALGKSIRISPQKMNIVAAAIRGLSVERAFYVLKMSRKRIALDVKKVLKSAVANAENNQGLNPEHLCVTEATVGRSFVMKRLDIKGRSRSGRIEKPFGHLRIVVSEVKD